MTTSAVILLVLAIVVVWGGLLVAILRLRAQPERADYPPGTRTTTARTRRPSSATRSRRRPAPSRDRAPGDAAGGCGLSRFGVDVPAGLVSGAERPHTRAQVPRTAGSSVPRTFLCPHGPGADVTRRRRSVSTLPLPGPTPIGDTMRTTSRKLPSPVSSRSPRRAPSCSPRAPTRPRPGRTAAPRVPVTRRRRRRRSTRRRSRSTTRPPRSCPRTSPPRGRSSSARTPSTRPPSSSTPTARPRSGSTSTSSRRSARRSGSTSRSSRPTSPRSSPRSAPSTTRASPRSPSPRSACRRRT